MSDKEQTSLFDDIKVVSIEEEMKGAYLDYAMSVIVSRALPDVRDGLKPVHRRILYSMMEEGLDYNKPHRKSATVVGAVMGRYHPHGDTAIYETMVRLAQDFNLRAPLVDGQGNFGSMDGDPPAAHRYTEARLSKIANEMLRDINSDAVDFQPNYDGSLEEPTVLPARFPNLLVNGSSGIAVGMATYVPTHNLGEVIDACCALIDNPDLSIEELMKYVPGPDFPTGGIILGKGGILQAYRTGRGSTIIRSKTHIEEIRGGREAIIITEIPYGVNKARMVERIAELVKEKIIEEISNLRDESDRSGVRVVIELKKDAIADVVLNKLYRFSPVQGSVNFNMLALIYGRPEQLSLKQILEAFVNFREDVVTRRTRFELQKARERSQVLMGFAISLANLDAIIKLIRESQDRASAKTELLNRNWVADDVVPLLSLVDDPNDPNAGFYKLTPFQADAILDLRLHRLTGLERKKIHEELYEIADSIAKHLVILGSRLKILTVVKNELLEVKEKFSSPRRTVIEDATADMEDEDLIEREDMVITVSLEGYIKRVPLATYRSQKRGGRGRAGMATKEEDIVNDVIVANTHNDVLFFSSLGQVYVLKGYQLPLCTPQSKGRAMVNIFPLSEKEKISTVLVVDCEDKNIGNKYLIFATSLGNVRRNKISDFKNINSKGKKAMKLDENEQLIGVKIAQENDDIFLVTRKGQANRFSIESVRIFAGRDSNGVRGIRLADGDDVINMSILSSQNVPAEEKYAYYKLSRLDLENKGQDESDTLFAKKNDEKSSEDIEEVNEESDGAPSIQLSPERFAELAINEQFILTITEHGFGKRTSAYAYRTTKRGTKGVTNIAISSKNGNVVSSFPVKENDDIILVTDTGKLIRCPVKDIRITSRVAKGVIVFRMAEEEKVVAVSRISGEKIEEIAEDGENFL
ncbi:MAG: DNA gyrase subunit A [Holosporales bacterium]|jgi:DNA gyrase subunit A|nr:DNA gyrase subunit A [Holosporales bacterium]